MKTIDNCSYQPCTKPHCSLDNVQFVGDEEQIIRLIFVPSQYNKTTKKIKKGVLRLKEIFETGISVNRFSLLTKIEYENHIKKIEHNRHKDTVYAFLCWDVSCIRNILGGKLMICPSSSKLNPSHADILYRIKQKTYGTDEHLDLLDEIRRDLFEAPSLCRFDELLLK